MHDPPAAFLSHTRFYSDANWRERQGPLGILRLSDALKVGLRAYESQLVVEARRQGATWEQIGEALGTQKQNAHRRFGHLG
jgi:hypothetical protein